MALPTCLLRLVHLRLTECLTALLQRLNLPNVVQTDMVYEVRTRQHCWRANECCFAADCLMDARQVLRSSHCTQEGSGALIPLWGASSCDGAFIRLRSSRLRLRASHRRIGQHERGNAAAGVRDGMRHGLQR